MERAPADLVELGLELPVLLLGSAKHAAELVYFRIEDLGILEGSIVPLMMRM